MSKCQICGLIYKGKEEGGKHDLYCKKHLRACVKFDKIYNPEECDAIRSEIEVILSSDGIPLQEKVDALVRYFRSYFSQSVRDSNFDLDHCSFLDYCAKLVRQKYFNDLIGSSPDIHDAFIERLLCSK